jgi:O-antigen/teichoic acid export membrane protein
VVDGREATRHAALMLAQRGLQGLGGLIFAMVVPRMLGPQAFGNYALITSLAGWFVMLGSLGLINVIARYMPGLVLQDDSSALRRLAGNLLTLRLLSGALVAGLYLALTAVAFVELDRVLLWLIAGSVWLQGVSTLLFALFLGLNRADLWGGGDTLRRWLTVLLVPLGIWLSGLRGAGAGLIVAEVIVIALGAWWIPFRFSWADLRPDAPWLAPFLRFGLVFFGSQLLFTAFQAGGEVLVRAVSGNYVEVAYFALAHSVYLTAAASMPPLVWSFAPLLSGLREGGDARTLGAWIERLLTLLAVASVVAVLGCLFLADVVTPLVFGTAYAPVAANLVPLSLGLVMLGLGTVTSLVALVHGRPGEALVASIVRLVAFWALGVVLVTWWGSLGACVAMAGASTVHAAYSVSRMRVELGLAVRRWFSAVAIGALPVPLIWLRSTAMVNGALCVAAIATYGLSLFLCGVVRIGDVRALGEALRGRVRLEGIAKK